jgi:DNA ligase-associated metallophosphoesterase
MTDVEIHFAGERLVLLPERALFWPRTATLVAADFHWGKGATFRAAGIPIPVGATSDDLSRLDEARHRTAADRLIVLGDLFHARAGRIASQTLAELRRWRTLHAELEIMLVRGNHDRHAGDPPDDLRVNGVNAPAYVPPFVLRHEPAASADGYAIAGHVHPGLVLCGPALRHERLPCFLVGPRDMLLPAFGSFTGMGMVDPGPADRAFVVADGEVIEVTPLER